MAEWASGGARILVRISLSNMVSLRAIAP
jgi:hypothetical protein